MIRRHEALRTTFQAPGGAGGRGEEKADKWSDEPLQIVHPAPDPPLLPLPIEDLRTAAGESVDTLMALAESRIASEASTPFDLAQGPLIRARLLRLSEDDHILLLSMHHIVSDGRPMSVLIKK